ncbi:MAG: Rieske 2Fe-2S domain-containing protein [Lacibacter sp.]|jgi:nitrite reductase/ring-hydroxylating ferredoxin subunit
MASPKQYSWHKIAESAEDFFWQENRLCELQVNDKTICIARNGDQVFACAHKCPHAGGHMVDGFVDTLGNIVCPLHRYRFSLQNGRNVSGEGYYLKTYPIEIREDGVYIGLEESRLFGLF